MTESDNELTYVTKDELQEFRQALFAELEKRFDEFVTEIAQELSGALCPDSETGEPCEEQEPSEISAKYVIFAGGQRYYASATRQNKSGGIDFFLHEVDSKTGKEYNSMGTINSPDVVVIDLKPDLNLETFNGTKSCIID